MNETFYGGFYGFDSAPFHITPDPALLFPTETHRAALGAIEYGISAGKGFIVVTGEVGLGKTTVLRQCLDGLDSSRTKIIYLFSPALSTAELYSAILDEFDVTLPPTSNAADTLRMLQRTLLATHQSGTQVVLAVDEAQQMPEATLESLRILSNLETHKSKLLQIILIGQPELEVVLAKHSLRQLAQRVAVRARIKPLSFRESCRYILHRTRRAGRTNTRPLFTIPALLYLAFVARGVPRTINICCDNALINGYGHAAERITFGIVRDSCRAMKFRPALWRSAAFAMAAMVLIGISYSGIVRWHRLYTAHAAPLPAMQGQSASIQPASPPVAQAVTPPSSPSPASPATDTPIVAVTAAGAAAGVPTTVPPGEERSATSARPASSEEGAAAAEPTSPGTGAPPEAPPALRASPSEAAPEAPIPWIPAQTSAAMRTERSWLVHEGDTVYKACRMTYGTCNERALREVLANNPRLGTNATIHEGEIIRLPAQSTAAASN